MGAFFLPVAIVSLRMFNFRSVQQSLERRQADATGMDARNDETVCAEVQTASRMVDAASRHGLVRGNCLSKSITLWWLLRRRGIPVRLRLGARRTVDQFEAHAWVEMNGRVVNDSEDVRTKYSLFKGAATDEMAAQK
ncbi:MAG: lasso peptide biosynthesis B2 protein [Candidatus Acidiferrales bacterium]